MALRRIFILSATSIVHISRKVFRPRRCAVAARSKILRLDFIYCDPVEFRQFVRGFLRHTTRRQDYRDGFNLPAAVVQVDQSFRFLAVVFIRKH